MSLDNLKPAWRQFRLLNSMQSLDMEEILLMMETPKERRLNKIDRWLINTIMFTVLTICCQAG